MWQHVQLLDALSWGPSAINLVVDEDVKNQPTKPNQFVGYCSLLVAIGSSHYSEIENSTKIRKKNYVLPEDYTTNAPQNRLNSQNESQTLLLFVRDLKSTCVMLLNPDTSHTRFRVEKCE